MNDYEFSELEGKDLYCEKCGWIISSDTYVENGGVCDCCVEPRIFVTSDLHFCHNRDFIYAPRGFSSVEEMNEAIIKNWNSVVTNNDEVFVLGDLALCDIDAGVKCIKQLKGNIHVIRGNHDTDAKMLEYCFCYNIKDLQEINHLKYRGYNFYLSHYPTITSNYDIDKPLKARVINLCGHSHVKDPFADWNKGLIYHCELDACDNKPILLDDIITDIKNKLKENER